MPAFVAVSGSPPVLVSHARRLIRTLPKWLIRGSATRGRDIVAERRFKVAEQEVRIVGFDCGEDEHHAVLLDGEGLPCYELRTANQRDRIEEAIASLLLRIDDGVKLIVVVESQRSHGRLVADVAEELGCEVWQVNTIALNHYRNVEGQPKKDDPWDAFLAARMVFQRTKGVRAATRATDQERALCRLGRLHARVTRAETRALHMIQSLILELAPEMLHSSWEGPKVKSKAMVYLLERWPGFEGMERAQLRSIEAILHQCRYGGRARQVAKLLRDVARRIRMAPEERRVVTMELEAAVEEVKRCRAILKRLGKEIEEAVERHPVGKRLLEMTGIGPLFACVLLGELLPVARVSTEAQSATYAGVTPISRKSGKTMDNSKLTRGSNKRVLDALYRSAVVARTYSAIDKAYYLKKVKGYQGHPKAHVAAFIALARQRHKVIYKILTQGARYDKEVLIASHLERLAQEREAAA